MRTALALLVSGFLVVACSKPAPKADPKPEPAPTPKAAQAEGVLRLGAAIDAAAQKVALSDVAKNPDAYVGKTFTTTGTVSAVCQHQGCWMEIKDDAGEAHIKMAGHAFFVPKTASGRKAKVLATLVKQEKPGGESACNHEGDHEGMSAAGTTATKDGKPAAKDSKAAPKDGKVAHADGKSSEAEKAGCRAEAEKQLGRPLAKLELVATGVELL